MTPILSVELIDDEELKSSLEKIGADPRAFPYFRDKRQILTLRVKGVDSRAANILKQELLSRGGDVAVHARCIDHGIERTECLLFGTKKQLKELLKKLEVMPYWGLPEIKERLSQTLDGLNIRRFRLTLPRGRFFDLGERTHIMGILNLTEESFYSGSRLSSAEQCLEKAGQMLSEGADILDLGAESTRPGATLIPADLEIERLLPSLRLIRETYPEAVISIDTNKAAVASRCLEEGADIINDISGLGFDEKMAETVARFSGALVMMHIQGRPENMQKNPHYDDLFFDIADFFEQRLNLAFQNGIPKEQIILDPGFGFGKTVEHNLDLMRHLEAFKGFGLPLLLGFSRKSTIGSVLDLPDPKDRLEGTLALSALCAWKGVNIVRVHDVEPNFRVIKMVEAVKRGGCCR